jgi:cobalt-zinc-cadmium efflux system outer membrane protein
MRRSRSRFRPWIVPLLLVAASRGWAAVGDAGPPTDPVLESLIEQSLAALPELKAAHDADRSAHERISQAYALPDPSLQVGVQNDSFTSWEVGKMETSWYSIMWSQTFPWPGKRKLNSRVMELGSSQFHQATQRLVLTTEADVRRAYLDLLLARDRLSLLDRLEAISLKSVTLARTRYEAGSGAQSDLLRAQLEVNRIKQRRWALQVQADNAVQSLNRLRGHPLDEPIATSIHLSELPLPSLQDESLAVQDALERSPELAAARIGVAERESSLELARKNRRPDLTINAGVMPRGGDFSTMWLVNVGSTLPIFTRSKQDKAVAENEARAAAAGSSAQAIEEVLRLRVRQRATAFRAIDDTIRLYLDGLLVQSEATAESTQAQYEVGRVTFAAVLEANAGFISDQDGYLQVLVQAQTLAIDAREVRLAPASVPGAGPLELGAPSSSSPPGSAASGSAPMRKM